MTVSDPFLPCSKCDWNHCGLLAALRTVFRLVTPHRCRALAQMQITGQCVPQPLVRVLEQTTVRRALTTGLRSMTQIGTEIACRIHLARFEPYLQVSLIRAQAPIAQLALDAYCSRKRRLPIGSAGRVFRPYAPPLDDRMLALFRARTVLRSRVALFSSLCSV